jgi:methanogenic corrinoid protein MtbC1
MENKTAVEWLVQQSIEKGIMTIDDINQALEMEKEQIVHAYGEGVYLAMTPSRTAEDYYEERYKSE